MLRRRLGGVDAYFQRRGALRSAHTSEPEPVFALARQAELVPSAESTSQSTPVPDLLHTRASTSIDWDGARRALEFAFTAGDALGIASGALASAALEATRFVPEAFVSELFLDELIEGVLRFKVHGRPAPLAKPWLRRLLCHPPDDLGTVAFRQAILRELVAEPARREQLLHSYACIVSVLELFDASAGQSRYAMPRWRLDLLGALRACWDSLMTFAETTSGLVRLYEYAKAVHESQAYRDLCALLDFESEMAEVDLRVRIGVDGSLRKLEVLRIAEQRGVVLYRGPWARLWWRVVSLLRGYRIDDLALVEGWFDHVYAGLLGFLPALLQLRGDLEFYLCACHFQSFSRTHGLTVCIPELLAPDVDGDKRLDGLWNPLLLLQLPRPVACSLPPARMPRTCVLTGPNSGGKTRLLQAIALCQLMGQAGFFVAAQRAVLRQASGMFVSLGQENSATQQEGRLGTELLRIRRLFEQALPGSLILLDELCSGTNPSEGEEIFRLVVDLLRLLRPEVYVTTHFLSFAGQLVGQADALNLNFLQVELDASGLPTFQFITGVAQTSLAQQTAARLGVSRDELVALIRRHRAL
jgi:DNA mismatch repair protein MutS2